MSTFFAPSPEDDLIQRVIADTAPTGATPPALPGSTAAPMTVQVGGEQVPVGDAAALQAALQRQEAAWRDEMRQVQQRQVPVQPQQVVVQQPPPVPGMPQPRLNLTEWGKVLEAEGPDAAIARALGEHMGLPANVSPKQLIEQLGQVIVQQGGALTKLQKDFETYQGNAAVQQVTSEANRFQQEHPEYIADSANFALLNQVRESLQLPATAQGLDLALLKAQQMGVPLKLRQRTQEHQQEATFSGGYSQSYQPSSAGYQQNTGYVPSAPQTGLPRFQQGGASTGQPSGGADAMIKHLESLQHDPVRHQQALERFKQALTPGQG